MAVMVVRGWPGSTAALVVPVVSVGCSGVAVVAAVRVRPPRRPVVSVVPVVPVVPRLDLWQYRRMSKPGTPRDSCLVPPLVAEPLNMATAVEMAAKFKALADPVRLRLLSSVASRAGGEACVCDISAGVEVSQPTVSHHLKVLRDAGLLTSQRRASWVYYAVVPEALAALSELLSSGADSAAAVGVSA